MTHKICLSAAALLALLLALPAPALAYDGATPDQPNRLSAGLSHTAYVDEHGTLWTWGSNQEGQLGAETQETGVDREGNQVAVSGTSLAVLEDVRSVAAGGDFTVALKTDGTLWAWGQFRPAMLREGQVDSSDPLVRTSALETECENEVVKITEGVAIAAACSDRVMAVMEDGSCWQLPLAYRLLDWQENQDQTPNRPEKILDQALLPNDPPAWAAEAPAPTVLESASLAALEDAESAAPQTEQTEASPEPVPDTAPESPLAGAWLPATAAAALAVIAWLRGRKH